MQDTTKFPSPIYKETVLGPIFHDFKANYYEEMMTINYAHTVMLTEQGIITPIEASLILRGLREIDQNIDLAAMEYTGEFEDMFFYIEKELIKQIGLEVAGKLHTGRSRNDINITLFKMKTKMHLRGLLAELIKFEQTLLALATRHKETIIIAYTHGQPAQPTTFGHYLAALIEIIGRDIERLFQAYQTTDQCSMGAAAITTSGFPLNRQQMADLLGFGQVQENSYGCIAAVDYILQVYSAIKILFINLGRFTQDLDFWTSFEIGHLYVPNEFVQISSIMPQKRNPVAIEHIRIQASVVNGLCDTMINAMHNTPFADMNDAEDPIQVVGYEAFDKAKRCLKLITGFVAGLQIDTERIKEHILDSFVTITELADSLVREENLSFREAHEIASLLVKDLVAQKLTLADMDYTVFAKFFRKVTHTEPKVTANWLMEVLAPTYFIKMRARQGGPAPEALTLSLALYKNKLDRNEERLSSLVCQEQDGRKLLLQKVERLVGS